MKNPRAYFGCSLGANEYIYVFGGQSYQYGIGITHIDSIEKLDVRDEVSLFEKTVSWEVLEGTTLSTPKYYAPAIALGQFIYVMGGYDNQNKALNTVDVLDVQFSSPPFFL